MAIIDPHTLSVIDARDYSHTFTWNTSGQILTDTFVANGSTFVKTYTYASVGGTLTSRSAWVKQ